MKAFGKEYPLALTVGALETITGICPGGDIRRLVELMKGPAKESMSFFVAFLVALSEGAEEQRKYEAMAEGESYTPAPLTPGMVRALSPAELQAAQKEALRIWKTDQQPSVEAEPSKKNGAPEADAASS